MKFDLKTYEAHWNVVKKQWLLGKNTVGFLSLWARATDKRILARLRHSQPKFGLFCVIVNELCLFRYEAVLGDFGRCGRHLEWIQDFFDCLGLSNKTDCLHFWLASRAFQDINIQYARHQVGPAFSAGMTAALSCLILRFFFWHNLYAYSSAWRKYAMVSNLIFSRWWNQRHQALHEFHWRQYDVRSTITPSGFQFYH